MPNSDLYRACASKSIISAFFLITSLYFRTIYPYSISAFTLLPTLVKQPRGDLLTGLQNKTSPIAIQNQPNRVFAWFFISSGGSSLSKSLQPADLKTILQQCKSSPVPRKHTAWRAPTWVYVNHHHRILHYVNSYWQGNIRSICLHGRCKCKYISDSYKIYFMYMNEARPRSENI